MQEDPEVTDFKNAVADTAEDAKKSVQSTDTKSTVQSADTKSAGSEKTVLEQVCSFHPLCPDIFKSSSPRKQLVSSVHFSSPCMQHTF